MMALLPRLPEDLLEKMPSASNSPATPRRRRSRISSLAQAIAAASDSVKAGGSGPDKFRHQLSVASMVQRFEKTDDGERTRGAGQQQVR